MYALTVIALFPSSDCYDFVLYVDNVQHHEVITFYGV